MKEMTIGMWLDEWFKVYVDELSENTVRNYKDARRRISLAYPNLETLALSELRPVAFQKMINDLGKKYSRSTLCHIRVLYNRIYKTAIMNQLCMLNPAQGIQIPKYASVKKVEALTIDEQEAFVNAAAKLPVMEHFALMTLLLTGLRCAELSCLTWEDWDKQLCVLIVRKSKTERGKREIPLIPEVSGMLTYLETRKSWHDCPFIFARNGHQVMPEYLRYICKKTGRIARISHVTPHILRHSFATRMIERGADPKSLSMIIGHSNVAFTLQRYVTVDRQHLADQMMLLSRQK